MARDWTPGRVPQPATPIVGRDRLVSNCVGVVGANRLVTLTGTGGVGKTRLAVEIAWRSRETFPDGVWMVELASVGDPAAVPDAIAQALGVASQGDGAAIDAVVEAVAGRRLLLVVDNCEHVAQAASDAITRILERSPTPAVLATSRESLWIAGEQRVGVAPLGLESGVDSEAARLFVDRARAVRLEFAVDDPAAGDAVVEICRTLDGLPLAIELAAARMASMTAAELRDRLEHRFRLLKGAVHRPERQQTLDAMVAWSYDLLPEEERHALLAASVFAGGFDISALKELVDVGDEAGPVDEVDLLACIDALVHRSLVVADPRPGGTRYRLLETIREFAVGQLAREDVATSLADRHAALFAGRCARQWERWNGPDWREVSDWLALELANLRAAYRWSVARGQIDVATDLAAHAALIGAPAQQFETVTWAEELVLEASDADVARLPRLCTGAGYACFAGRPVSAAEHAHTATLLETRPEYDPCEPGLATFVEALARVYAGDLERYVELSGQVARLPGAARAFGLPAYVDGLQASGRVEAALALTEESVEAARRVGNPFWIAYALWTAGLAHAAADPHRALAAWDEGTNVVRDHRVDFFAGFIGRDAARVHAAEGNVDEALALFAAAIDSFQRIGNVAQLIITVALLPEVFERSDQLETAAILRAAILREPASIDHVPGLGTLGDRLAARLEPEAIRRCAAVGSRLDLYAAATYAREQVDITRAALARIYAHKPPGGLSRRQVEVLRLVADGLSTREIASRLFISAKTADHHIQHIYTKAGVSNRAAATRWAVDQGVVSDRAEA